VLSVQIRLSLVRISKDKRRDRGKGKVRISDKASEVSRVVR
jgi:hypothetical protein